MLFNSIDFAIFFPIVFFLYWFVANKNLKAQNFLLVVASFIFYGWWDWRFLILMVVSASVDFFSAIYISRATDKIKRRTFLAVSIFTNLAILFFFKYFNFFTESFASAFQFFGYPLTSFTFKIVLPVGISFYTFQAMSYSIDVYRDKLNPTKSIVDYFAFISFFPQLVAGPIERATHLLPQFYTKRIFSYEKSIDGLRQILWGLFKKIVIADRCAEYANAVFNNYQNYSGSTLIFGAVFFAFQIYADFSGYSDIAIGTARLFGFSLMRNFSFPYFSRDIAEFWRRWHISLSTWFRDYLYVPLGGNKGDQWMKIRNIFIVFTVSGLWHGANWTFLVWGLLNAIYFLPLLLLNKNRSNLDTVAQGRALPSFSDFSKIIGTFLLTTVAWIFFRSETIRDAFQYINNIFSYSIFQPPSFLPIATVVLILVFILVEWLGREEQFAIQKLGLEWRKSYRFLVYYSIVLLIFISHGKDQQFIYFQF